MELTVKDYQTMRDALARLCEYFSENQVPRESLFTSRLVASELVGNVLRHSMGEARIRGEVKEGYVELVVFSSVHFVPPKKSVCAEVLSEHGRGLFIVDKVCEERSLTEDGGILVKIKFE